jgi:mRNA-degrading endonuclease YafQ of YafQ-DinJ toxin-antitoxin module
MESDNMYKITYTDRFLKSFNRIAKIEQLAFEKKMRIFINNNLHTSLRTKKIQGQKELYESSINMDIRIIWYYENQELIVLVDIGHHDILRKF